MNKAYQVWRNGRSEWDVFNAARIKIATVSSESELATVATIDAASNAFVRCECIRADEPRFLVRDESGRGWAGEWRYTDFSADERDYREEGTDTDYAGNEIEFQTLGEWLDSSDAGDEFDNSDAMLTIIRIN